ncbi:MAG: hypothetical protein JSV32_08255 [Dehalococcoidia bacterium]|nr:MAG: hypothetical protein JSV32_08255 [Dehalococcoidia bacterium]
MINADDFAIPITCDLSAVKVRIIDQITNLVTKEAIVNMPVTNGMLHIDTSGDLLKVAVIERTYKPGETFVGFIRGFKLKYGAVASSGAWDMSGIVVVGADESDMAQAVNRIKQLSGGLVVCAGGEILAETPMPIGGLISLKAMETLVQELNGVQHAAANLGFPYPDIRLTLNVLTSPAIAYLRISEDGLFDIRQNCFVDLVI